MPTYARVQGSVVVELLSAPAGIEGMFNPSLSWVEVDPTLGVAPGWLWNGTKFQAPPPQSEPPSTPVLQTLQAQISQLQAALAAIAATGLGVTSPLAQLPSTSTPSPTSSTTTAQKPNAGGS
jgi:hypothetical protein